MKPFLIDGPLMTTIERRRAMIENMARTLIDSGEVIQTDPDAVRVLLAKGYGTINVAVLAGEARTLAYQETVVAKEMSDQ